MFCSGRRFVLCFTLCLTTGATLKPTLASGDAEAGADAPIDRFRRVDARLYRGAQPDAEGFRYLRQLGVRTVINLRGRRLTLSAQMSGVSSSRSG